MTPSTDRERLIERLGDVLDIVAAAEQQWAETDEHHAYYGERHKAVQETIEALSQGWRSEEVLREALIELEKLCHLQTRQGMLAIIQAMRRLLCLIGVHDWKRSRFVALGSPSDEYDVICQRCRKVESRNLEAA